MSSIFKMKLNLSQQSLQQSLQIPKPSLPIQRTHNLVLSSTKRRILVPLKVTGNKRCASCGH
jgi:hypothetical protein